MIHEEIFFGLIAISFRVIAMVILGWMISKQRKVLQLKLQDGSKRLRQFLFFLLVALFLQNIIPVFTVILEINSPEPIIPFLYWLNNAFFTLTVSIVLLNLYIKE